MMMMARLSHNQSIEYKMNVFSFNWFWMKKKKNEAKYKTNEKKIQKIWKDYYHFLLFS